MGLDVAQPDDDLVQRGIDKATGLVQRPIYRLTLGLGQVDDGPDPGRNFAESIDQIGEEFD